MFELATRFQTPIADLPYLFTQEEWFFWQSYLSEPRGDERRDWNTAMIVEAVCNVVPSLSGKRRTKLKTKDYLLKFTKMTTKGQTPVEAAKALNKIFGDIIPKENINGR